MKQLFAFSLTLLLLLSACTAATEETPTATEIADQPTATAIPTETATSTEVSIITVVAPLITATKTAVPPPSPTLPPTPTTPNTPIPPTAVPPVQPTTCSDIPDAECEALRDLYTLDSTGQSAWFSSETACGWQGVSCATGHVTQVFFANSMLTGNLPQSLADLSHLKTLNLSDNNLTGTLPSELSNLPALEELILYSNDFSGKLPATLGDLPAIVSMDLSNNNFSGEIPTELGQLSTLQGLNLNNNNLTGALPSAFTQMPSLGWLDVSFNQLSGNLSADFHTLPFINIEGNTLTLAAAPTPTMPLPQPTATSQPPTATPPPPPTSTSVATFSCNNIVGIPISECEALVALHDTIQGLRGKQGWLIDNQPCNWEFIACGNNHVNVIDIQSEQLSGELPWEDLYKLTDLRVLVLANNNLTGELPSDFNRLEKLSVLILDSNQFHGELPDAFGWLPNLNMVVLSDNRFSGTLPETIGGLTSLNTLLLNGSEFMSGPIPHSITQLQNLSTFDYSGTALCAPQTEAFQTWLTAVSAVFDNGQLCAAEENSNAPTDSQVFFQPFTDCRAFADSAFETEECTILYNFSAQNDLSGLTGWFNNTTTPICEWEGLTCTEDGRFVDKLFMPSQSMSVLPSTVGNFKRITRLSVWNSNLDMLPAEIGRLSTLTYLINPFSLGGKQTADLAINNFPSAHNQEGNAFSDAPTATSLH